jgi:hypothetical protein
LILKILKSGSPSVNVNKIRTLKYLGSALDSFIINGVASENGLNECFFELKLDNI